MIGDVDHEGVTSNLFQTGRRYKKKVLHSAPENWQSIIDLFDGHSVSTVLVKLTARAYELLAHESYSSLGNALLTRIATIPHVIYVHEGLYTGAEDDPSENEPDWAGLVKKPKKEVRILVNSLLDDLRLNLATYKRNSEVTVSAQAFLSQSETGLLLRLYVPNAQLWARETDRFLHLFRDYLTAVARLNVRLDETRTRLGVIYELHDDPHRKDDFSTQYEKFSEFVRLCASDMKQAELILKNRDIAQAEIIPILTRFTKEARRLAMDMRQELEQKVLSIRHRCEAELIDVLPSACTVETLGLLVDVAIPATLGPTLPLLISGTPAPKQAMTININPQFVNTVNGIVAQEVSGDVYATENDRQLFQLFAEHAKDQQAELASALRELKDESAPRTGRESAKQKLFTFLRAVGSKTADVGVGILNTYLEKMLDL